MWNGVRNVQVRNDLAAMQKGDRVLFYHSVAEIEVDAAPKDIPLVVSVVRSAARR